MFWTLQDRLPKELALAGLMDMAVANRWLRDSCLPAFNQHVQVPREEPGTACVPWIGTGLAEFLCDQEERIVATDNRVHDQGLRLQIPQDPHRFHDVKITGRVHDYPEGTLAVCHGPRCMARYQTDGQLRESDSAPPP